MTERKKMYTREEKGEQDDVILLQVAIFGIYIQLLFSVSFFVSFSRGVNEAKDRC